MPVIWSNTMNTNLHHTVTQQIITAMKSSKDFVMPWHSQSAMPLNATTDNCYTGINALNLWAISQERLYGSSIWATYKQWQSIGAQVSKGETGSKIVIYKPLPELKVGDVNKPRVLLRSATVFNVSQVTGWLPLIPLLDKTVLLEAVDQFVANSAAKIEHGGDRACYISKLDKILMPERALFNGSDTSSETEAYYSTLLHELTHWTGIESRCNRDMSGRFSSENYAIEELVAELGAAFLCSELGVTNSPRQDHADYISSWIAVLQYDPKAIFWAAARASEAVAYLSSLQSKSILAQ